jgi:hypothetical protein
MKAKSLNTRPHTIYMEPPPGGSMEYNPYNGNPYNGDEKNFHSEHEA